ncbi:MAG TPA: TonB-dependent receptor [Sphingomicrobium sp.]|nr:TonB-dependent receptor [Sphingomicrobium sp.]
MSNTKAIRGVLLSSTIVAGLVFATPAFAQDEQVPAEGESTAQPQEAAQEAPAAQPSGSEIVVTGTRIARPNLEQSAPVTVVGAEEIAFQQPTSAEDFLRQLPGAAPAIGPQTNNGSDGSARVNLRGLGTNRNLVLLNSRRVTPRGTDAVVDLNTIPIALIERTDVYTGGASTVYGADAVAGVVNFITRRDFAGIEVNGLYGITEQGDGARYRVDLTLGANFDDGRGNAVLSVGYTKTKPVLQGDREIGEFARSSATGLPQGSTTAAPASITFTGAAPPTGSPNDIANGLCAGGQFAVNAAGDQIVCGQNDYNFNPLNLFQTPLERWNIYGQAHYEISPAVEAYAEAMYVNTNVEINLAPAGVFQSSVNVRLNNPFLTPQQALTFCQASINSPAAGSLPAGTDCAAAIAAGTIIPVNAVGRRFVEAGPRRSIEDTNMFHVTAGLRGPLTSTLDWDIFGSYGESDRKQTRIGWGLLSRVREGVLGCPAGSQQTCVPFDLFGEVGSITPEMLASIDIPTFFFSSTEFAAAQGLISGDLGVASPWASEPIGIAVGAEYRRYGAASQGDAISRIPGEVLGAGAAALPIDGEYNTKDAFAELNVPIVEDREFFHNLSLEAGARYADYSTSGGNWTWKVGGSWMPIRDIKFRGVYSKAVRAPNIAELFQPQVVALTARTTDPCQGPLSGISAQFQTLCLAQLAKVGAPAVLLGSILPPTAGQIQSTQGGNPDLDPEKARTITAGVVLEPQFIPGLAVTIDYWDIKVTDAISAPTASDIIDGCFSASPNLAFCDLIFRNPATGQLSGPAETTFGPTLALGNLGTIQTDGFDLGASYRRDLGFANLNVNLNATWTRDFLFQATPQSINRQCDGYYSASCGTPLPELAWNMRTTLSFAKTDVSLNWRHIGKVEVEPVRDTSIPDGSGKPNTAGPTTVFEDYRKIDAFNYFDLSLQQHIADTLRLTFTITNLFDKNPPDVGNTIAGPADNSGNTFPTLYDPLGRRYTMGVNLRF